MNINKYFDKIYLLNLFKRKDRLEKTTNKLNSLGIDYSIFNGVDGSVLNKIWKSLNNSYFTNSNYVGCTISHLSIYASAIENNYNRILIVEDDILINNNLNTIFSNIEIPDWEDLFYLGYIPLNDDCSMWDYRSFGMQSYNKINEEIFKPSNLWGLYSYGISLSLMKEMVDTYNSDFPMEIDRYYVNNIQKRGKSIALSPQLFCCDDNVYSDNLGYSPIGMINKSIDQRFASIENFI